MHRFFLPPDAIGPEQVYFPVETAHQLARVLRLQPGQRVMVLNNRGEECIIELVEVSPQSASGRVIERRESAGEPQVSVFLYLGLTQREKFEWVLQKGTEVGISGFIPVITRRSLVQEQHGLQPGSAKYQRWRRILQEAAEQSGRGRIPELHPPQHLLEALAETQETFDLAMVLWEGEFVLDLRSILHEASRQSEKTKRPKIGLLVGPEGGFGPEEVELARQSGWQPVSLGPRILRMETAAVVAAALVLYEFGEMKFKPLQDLNV
jgi:16S rRNA (uracil1498-N3)-methyltransferase